MHFNKWGNSYFFFAGMYQRCTRMMYQIYALEKHHLKQYEHISESMNSFPVHTHIYIYICIFLMISHRNPLRIQKVLPPQKPRPQRSASCAFRLSSSTATKWAQRASALSSSWRQLDSDRSWRRKIMENWGKIQLWHQWPFQEPKLEVPTIYKAYVRPM